MNSFTIYKEYYELITLLNEKEQQELCLAIMKYMFEDATPVLNEKQTKIFNNLKRPLDKSKNKSKNGSIIKSNENQKEIKTKSNKNQKGNTSNDVNVDVNDNVNVLINNSNNNIFNYFEKNIHELSQIEMEELLKWQEVFNDEIIKYAIHEAAIHNAKSLAYINKILQELKKKKVKKISDIKSTKEDKPIGELFEYDWLNEEE